MKLSDSTGPHGGSSEKRDLVLVEQVPTGGPMGLRLLRLSPWPGSGGQRHPEPGARVFAFGDGATVLISDLRTPQQALDMGTALLLHLNEARQRLRGRRARHLNSMAHALVGLPEAVAQIADILHYTVQDCLVVSHGAPAAYLALMGAYAACLRSATAMAEGGDRAMLQHLLIHWTDGLRLAERAARISLPAPVMTEGRTHG